MIHMWPQHLNISINITTMTTSTTEIIVNIRILAINLMTEAIVGNTVAGEAIAVTTATGEVVVEDVDEVVVQVEVDIKITATIVATEIKVGLADGKTVGSPPKARSSVNY